MRLLKTLQQVGVWIGWVLSVWALNRGYHQGVLVHPKNALLQQSFSQAFLEKPQSSVRWISFLSLGLWPMWVDQWWIEFLQDRESYLKKDAPSANGTAHPSFQEGDAKSSKPPSGMLSFRLLQKIVILDPAFFDAYFYGANALLVMNHNIQGAEMLLKKAEHFRTQELALYPVRFQETFWKQRFFIPLLLGYLYVFEKHNLETGARFFSIASKLPYAPQYLLSFSEKLKSKKGRYEVGLRLLRFWITQYKKDPVLKKRYQMLYQKLHASQYLYDLNQAFRDFLSQTMEVSSQNIGLLWKRFVQRFHIPKHGPLGGSIWMDSKGVVHSTGPIDIVFGMKYWEP